MPQQWEYRTELIRADISSPDIQQFLAQHWPHIPEHPAHTPRAMIPYLNSVGEKGWELVHMEPVARVNQHGDIGFGDATFPGEVVWSNVYFCVFKRPKGVQP